ncbi:hypothetical protein NLJ89_g7657 [Agrocybe chaxingu]|uniref:Uncharacterized protein n=1 Tax=Agrocybe chaxingu TaxID=84603 RepID=A0A9W8MTG9_9AGAR|nr:hypothetical protein NLJ89_g7657 [Agrocybe chaxingu]
MSRKFEASQREGTIGAIWRWWTTKLIRYLPSLNPSAALMDQVWPPDLKPFERAKFATSARLLSCLVTESIVRAFYQSLDAPGLSGFATIFRGDIRNDSAFSAEDVLAIVPLRYPPVFKYDGVAVLGQEIGLLDPLDMVPVVFETVLEPSTDVDTIVEHDRLVGFILSALRLGGRLKLARKQIYNSTDPISLWTKFATCYKLDEEIQQDIAEEFSSSVKWQAYSYANPPKAPLFEDSSIIWEQSIVEGHPTHPVNGPAYHLSSHLIFRSVDLLHPRLRFISIPKENAKITYDFERLTKPLLEAAYTEVGKPLEIQEGHVVVPVHELQVFHIKDKFPEASIYPEEFNLPLLAQQSIRSVVLTSAVRTISPESAYLGPRFSTQVVPVLFMDRNLVTVAKELASIVHQNTDSQVAKHCAAIVRECHEDGSEERGERLIVCTSLVEKGHAGLNGHLPAVIRVFELDTQEKRLRWLEKFISVFLKAFLPPMLHNGVAFECHPQNCVARFDLKTKELKGFIIRDFGGLRIHPETLKATTNIDLDFLAGHSIIAETLDDVYTRMYHTIIHNHFQQLIRVLGLHHNGLGWEVVRQQLRQNIPKDHTLTDAWLSPDKKTFPGKCFLRMRMASMYRFHLHGPFPNLIHYKGCEQEDRM